MVDSPLGPHTELRLGDLLTVLRVARSSSLAAIARESHVTTSQVSKAIVRVETHFGRELVTRSSRGVLLNEAGRELVPLLQDVVESLENARRAETSGPQLTFAAPSYLQLSLLRFVVPALPDVRLRVVELPPALLRAHAGDYGFELMLLHGPAGTLPAGWSAEVVGEVESGLFATPALAARLRAGARGPLPERVLEGVPFVVPLHFREGQFTAVDDGCPVPRSRRRIGHQVQTIAVALEIAKVSEQLVFGPLPIAERYVRDGELERVEVEGWDTRDALTLVCHGERVSAKTQAALAAALRRGPSV